jgi:hypothetical protein
MGFDNLYFHKNGEMPGSIWSDTCIHDVKLKGMNFVSAAESQLRQHILVSKHAI